MKCKSLWFTLVAALSQVHSNGDRTGSTLSGANPVTFSWKSSDGHLCGPERHAVRRADIQRSVLRDHQRHRDR